MPSQKISHKIVTVSSHSRAKRLAVLSSLENILCHLVANPLNLINPDALNYLFDLTPQLIDVSVNGLSSTSQDALAKVSNIVLESPPQANEDVSQILIQMYTCIYDLQFNPDLLREAVIIQGQCQSTNLTVPEEEVDSYLSQPLTIFTPDQVEELTPPIAQYCYNAKRALQAANTKFKNNPKLIAAIRTIAKHVIIAQENIAHEKEEEKYTQIMEIIAGHLSTTVCPTGEEAHFANLVLELGVRFSSKDKDSSQALLRYEAVKQVLMISAKILKELGIPDHLTSDVHHVRELVATYLHAQGLESLPPDIYTAGYKDKIRGAQGSIANHFKRHLEEFIHSLMVQHRLLSAPTGIANSHMPLIGLLNLFGMAQVEKREVAMSLRDEDCQADQDDQDEDLPMPALFLSQDNTLENWLAFFRCEIEKGHQIKSALVIRLVEAALTEERTQLNYVQLELMLRISNAGISIFGILAQSGDFERFRYCCEQLVQHHATILDQLINIAEVLELAVLGGNNQIITYVRANADMAFQTYLFHIDQTRYAHLMRLAAESGNLEMMASIIALPTSGALFTGPLVVVDAILTDDDRGNNAIMRAAMSGNLELFNLLIAKLRQEYTEEEISQIINQPNQAGQTPLLLAAHYGRGEICLKLAELGANLNYRMPHTSWDIFEIVFANRQFICLAVLLNNQMFRERFSINVTRYSSAIVELLYTPPPGIPAADIISIADKYGHTIICTLVSQGYLNIMELINNPPPGLTTADILRIPGLVHLLLSRKTITKFMEYISNPPPGISTADILRLSNHLGDTVAHILGDNHYELLMTIIQSPPQGITGAEILRLANNKGETVAHFLVIRGFSQLKELLYHPPSGITAAEILRLADNKGKIVAHCLAFHGMLKLIELLDHPPSDITAAEILRLADSDGITTAHYFALYGTPPLSWWPSEFAQVLYNPPPGITAAEILKLAANDGTTVAHRLAFYRSERMLQIIADPPEGITAKEILNITSSTSSVKRNFEGQNKGVYTGKPVAVCLAKSNKSGLSAFLKSPPPDIIASNVLNLVDDEGTTVEQIIKDYYY
jgi:hypothetical protein